MLAEDITRYPAADADSEFAGYLVSDPGSVGPHDSVEDILGDFAWLAENRDKWDGLAMGIGNAAPRLIVADELEAVWGPGHWPSLVHPTAHFEVASSSVGHGVPICANVIGTVNLVFEPFVMVNLSCTIGHEAVLKRGCTLNPSVNISGGVTVGTGTLVGTGAQILQYLEVGNGSIVGAGALVTKVVGDGVTAVGMPDRAR
jgi:UDP-3-O-[3-hydroxymyristoyl] glucosamine N-acyltransferase